MNKTFSPIDPADFLKVGAKPEFMKVEDLLVAIGGGSLMGMKFKSDLLKACGWNNPKLTSYTKNPKLAAEVFNKIIAVLNQTNDKKKIAELLKIKL